MNTVERMIAGQGAVVVVGLGYVGLPLAVALAEKVRVVGYDCSSEKVRLLRAGIDPTGEVGNEALQRSALEITDDPASIGAGDVVIIAVPTPINADTTPDLSPVLAAGRTVGAHLKDGAVVVYESTVYPGVTEEMCVPAIEAAAGKRCGTDFFIGYSPERINPGDKVHTLRNICKIVSAMNEEVCEMLARLYGLVAEQVYKAPSIKVAEAAKLLENTQRDINIALMNESAMLFDAMGISTKAVVDAMDTKWNALGFRPGLVGGHCIGVDPYYLIYKANLDKRRSALVSTAREINDHMSRFVVDTILNKMITEKHSLKNDKIYFFGITFKPDCPDVRNSRSVDIVKMLRRYGLQVTVVDPWADGASLRREHDLELLDYETAMTVTDADCLIFAVDHREFRRFTPERLAAFTADSYAHNKAVVIDIKTMYEQAAVEACGLAYWGL